MKKDSFLDISERKFLLRIIDIVIIFSCLFLSFKFLEFNYYNFNNDNLISWLILLIIYYLIFGEIFQLYNLNVSNNRYLVTKSIVITAFVTTIFYVFTPYFSPVLPNNRLQIVYFFLILFLPVLIWRFLYIQIIFSPKYFKTILFIGHSSLVKKLLTHIKNDNFHHVAGYVSEQKIDGLKGYHDINSFDLSYLVENNPITEVVVSEKNLSNENVSFLNQELIANFKKGINIISYETFYETVTSRVPKEYLDHTFYKNLNFSKNNSNRFYLFGLRFIDIVISILGLLIFIFLMPFLIIGNLIGNRGSLFYTQERVGQNTKLFTIYKLRSMVKNAESNGAVWAEKDDVRITPFGKFLRNTRLDEFPQFFNILKGDMSLIGPRPERPEFVKSLEKEIPFYPIRHVVRPGLTGWAQVNYPYANTIEEQETKLLYDLYYIKERDTFLDFKILIKTITTVLFFKGQ